MRKFHRGRLAAMAIMAFFAASSPASAQYLMENLGRGVVAINQGQGKVFVSWRLLGTEPDNIAFNIYRSTSGNTLKLNAEPLKNVTFFIDNNATLDQPTSYFVKSILDGKEQDASHPFTFPANAPARPYLSVPLQTPAGYSANDASVGDLDGDGEYEIIIHMTGRAHDNSQRGPTDPPILQAYKLDGTLLWTINLGKNIREGAHYTQFMVYDLNGDGRAEMVCKTGDGTIDGTGKVIGDPNANHVNEQGLVLSGPEYLTVFDGPTGKAIDTTKYIPGRHPTKEDPTGDELKAVWGDNYGNRSDRFLACIAYLDGVHPSVVMCRGYYTRSVLAAWDLKEGKLVNRWVFDSHDGNPANRAFAGQGHHNLAVADVDGDGKDEIVYGDMVVDDNGKGLYSTGCGHGDTLHVSDLDPTHPGLEVFSIQERFDDAGAHMFDAKTGQMLWKKPSVKAAEAGGDKGEGPGRGVAFDVDPRYPGAESWTAGAGITGMWSAKGELISDVKPGSCNFAVWWDGDVLRELLDRNRISKWNWEKKTTDPILTADGCESCNGTKSTPCLSGDILGDWREEVIWRTSDNKELRIYTTTIPTDRRIYTLMHDPQYREAITWQNVAYNQPPHPSFYIGEGMKAPPKPHITLVKPIKPVQ